MAELTARFTVRVRGRDWRELLAGVYRRLPYGLPRSLALTMYADALPATAASKLSRKINRHGSDRLLPSEIRMLRRLLQQEGIELTDITPDNYDNHSIFQEVELGKHDSD